MTDRERQIQQMEDEIARIQAELDEIDNQLESYWKEKKIETVVSNSGTPLPPEGQNMLQEAKQIPADNNGEVRLTRETSALGNEYRCQILVYNKYTDNWRYESKMLRK